jgi:hypothetical protein
MPLYRVTFIEQGGYHVQTRIRVPAAADHIAHAVQKIWGTRCYWVWVPGSDTEGRVYEQRGGAPDPDDVARTSVATVQLAPARRRPRAG